MWGGVVEVEMSELRKRYVAALKEMALGMFTAPFRNGYFDELWQAFSEFSRLFLMFWFWMLSIATYPVSVFFFAGLSLYSDMKNEKAIRKAHEEFMR
jgi:hypothetical protein